MREKHKIKTTEKFIEDACVVHGDRYDYSLTDYKGTLVPIKIICKVHGVFEQKPRDHLRGHGCQECGHESMFREPLVDGKRQCSKCKDYFELDCFYIDKSVSDGLSSWCKGCAEKATKIWKDNNVDQRMEWQKTYCKNKWAKFKKDHKDEFEQRAIERELRSIECKRADKIRRTLKRRLRDAFTRKSDTTQIKEILGCTIKEFETYMESLWTEGMSWENQGYYGWHFDHIIPCAAFDLDNEDEVKKCFHYTNYQPLWRKPNQVKQAKYNGVNYKKKKI